MTRGRKPIPIYIYQNQEYLGKAYSQQEAAKLANITPNQVGKIAKGEQKCTNRGFYFSFSKLTQQEIEKLPIKEKTKEEKLINNVDEIQLYQPSSKSERIEMFKAFIFSKLSERWERISKNVATLEKQYVKEFLKSI